MRRWVLGTMLALALATTSFLPATAADPQSELERIQDEIASLESQIAAAEAEKSAAAQQLSGAQARVQEILGELTAAQEAVDVVKASIASEEANLAELQSQLEKLEHDLAETRAEIASTQSDLEVQVVQMYMDASTAGGTAVLAFDSAADVAVGLAYSAGLAANSEDVIDGFVALRKEEERQQADVDTRKAGVEEVLAGLEADRQVLETDLARVRELQAQAKRISSPPRTSSIRSTPTSVPPNSTRMDWRRSRRGSKKRFAVCNNRVAARVPVPSVGPYPVP